METAPPPQHSLTPASDLRTLGPWYAVEALNSFAATLLTAGCYDYVHDVLGASPSAGLWLSASWGAAYIPISLLAGRTSERWGPRAATLKMAAASIFTALIGLLAIYFQHVWVVLLILLPYNFTSSHIWPAVESALSRTPAKMRLSSRMALYNVSWGSAGFVAFFTRGPLERLHWSTIFIVPAIAGAIGWAILWRWGVPASMISKDHVPEESQGEHDMHSPDLQRRAKTLLHMAWVGNAVAYVAINSLIPLLAPLGKLAGMETLVSGGMITSAWSFTRFIGFALVMVWIGWHYKVRFLLGAQLTIAICFLIMLTVHHPVVFIVFQLLFGLAAALIYSSSLYYAMHVSSGHGGHAGSHEALLGIGIAVGPSIGALVATGEIGTEATFRIGIGLSAILLAGTIVMAWMSRSLQSPPPQSPQSPPDPVK